MLFIGRPLSTIVRSLTYCQWSDWKKTNKNKTKLDDTAFEEALSSQKSPLWNQIRATDAKWASTPTFVVFTQHAEWKIMAPQVNQTGEVRLLLKLLNQKVDTECCVCSGEKTLTVQGLWVCKKTESLGEMHPQAPELLTFGYAYETVLAQSKQKKKKPEAVLCRWTLILVFTHLQVTSSCF